MNEREESNGPPRGSVRALEETLKELQLDLLVIVNRNIASPGSGWEVAIGRQGDARHARRGEGRSLEEALRAALKMARVAQRREASDDVEPR